MFVVFRVLGVLGYMVLGGEVAGMWVFVILMELFFSVWGMRRCLELYIRGLVIFV